MANYALHWIYKTKFHWHKLIFGLCPAYIFKNYEVSEAGFFAWRRKQDLLLKCHFFNVDDEQSPKKGGKGDTSPSKPKMLKTQL